MIARPLRYPSETEDFKFGQNLKHLIFVTLIIIRATRKDVICARNDSREIMKILLEARPTARTEYTTWEECIIANKFGDCQRSRIQNYWHTTSCHISRSAKSHAAYCWRGAESWVGAFPFKCEAYKQIDTLWNRLPYMERRIEPLVSCYTYYNS